VRSAPPQKKLQARVSKETHKRVRQAAIDREMTVDKLIEDAVLE
jgi:hypothetical protein